MGEAADRAAARGAAPLPRHPPAGTGLGEMAGRLCGVSRLHDDPSQVGWRVPAESMAEDPLVSGLHVDIGQAGWWAARWAARTA